MDRDMQLPTILTLPPSLPYPVTITKLHVKPGDAVRRGQKLISYTYAMVDRDMATVDSTQYQNDADRDGNGEGREESGGAKGGARVRLPKRVGPKIRKAGGDWDSPLEGEVVQWEDGIKEGVLIGGSG
jgi:RNA polymerase II subunit A-like phosphatase